MTAALRAAAGLLDIAGVDDQALIEALQLRRQEQLEALAGRSPDQVPTASLVRLRASRLEEVRLIEDALLEAGAPFGPQEADQP